MKPPANTQNQEPSYYNREAPNHPAGAMLPMFPANIQNKGTIQDTEVIRTFESHNGRMM